ncbi:MAG TPA: trehalose-phosphatase [Bradyrhizobium sp.]|nr:trehalose-phosphatase [Bradyrhizobium sp.]
MDIAAPSLVPNLQECAILLDVDGTILDLAATPREVWVPPSLRRDMARLSERTGGALALVSGRSVQDLDLLFAPLQLPAIGGHGAEFRPHAGGELKARRVLPLEAKLKRRFAAVAELGPGVVVEDKGYSIALHYRLAPALEGAITDAVARICAENASAQIEVLPGKSVLEIKHRGFSKGSGVRELMRYPPFRDRHPIFIGDDVTDESVFSVIAEFDGLAFSVGRVAAGVDGHFAEPGAVRGWLTRIADGSASLAQ